MKEAVEQYGLNLWGEIFGPNGGECEYCEGGYCRFYRGLTNDDFDMIEDCGYCFYYEDERLCIQTNRALSVLGFITPDPKPIEGELEPEPTE